MRIKRVHINVDSHIVHDATQRIACPHFPFFILTNGHFFRKRPSQKKERENIIRRLFGKTGKSFLIEQPFYCDYGYNIEIGENFYSNVNCVILDGAKVTFGDNVFVAPNCGFYTAGHALDAEQRIQGLEYAYPITIGNNVWIGAQVCVLPGVTIGDNTIIGAGSVVTKSIPANVLAVGNPCRVLRTITEADRAKYISE